MVQVYDTQEHTLQSQGFRSEEGVKKCVIDVKSQLDEQGSWQYERGQHALAFDAIDIEDYDEEADDAPPRRISVDVFEVYVND